MKTSSGGKQSSKGRAWQFADDNPFRSYENPKNKAANPEVSWLWEQLHAGTYSLDDLLVMGDGVIDVMSFCRSFEIVADPLHPANNWRSVVEQMRLGDKVYLRLAREIPIDVKLYWESHGKPPTTAWGYATGEIMASDQRKKASPTSAARPSKQDSGNPYPMGSNRHAMFDLATEFRPREEILQLAVERLGFKRKNATNIWWDLANSEANGGRSTVEKRTRIDGMAEVRIVSLLPS